MKKIYFLVAILLATFIHAQTTGITYQAVILNPVEQKIPGYNFNRTPLANKQVCLDFKITSANSVDYEETILTTTDEFGMVNVIIGTGVHVRGTSSTLAGINWDGNPKNLLVGVDITASCSNFKEISNQPFTAVPFALYAANSGTPGTPGPEGKSAYEVWLDAGNSGTEADYLASIQGTNGKSAYEVWLSIGNVGTEAEFIASLTGPAGIDGLLPDGTAVGNTTYWDGTKWVVNSSNIYNNGNSIGIGTITPDASASLEVNSTTQGFLPPRMTTVQRDAIVAPALGLIIFNTTSNCLNFYLGTSWREFCEVSAITNGTISSLSCDSSTNIGLLTLGTLANGVTSSIPYLGGNGGTYSGQTVNSTGVTGLTATLAAGTFANGDGTLIYNITGVPTTSGTASFVLNIGGQTCVLELSIGTNIIAKYPAGTVLCAAGPTAIIDVTNPVTGKTWMDRNLGATRAAIHSWDTDAYGDLYQWGRGSDGHQCINSITTTILSSTDQPGHGDFIIGPVSPYDWRRPQNNNLWQGVNGVNNPCPSGYRVPTEAEFLAEGSSWRSQNSKGAYTSPLKWPLTGIRAYDSGITTYEASPSSTTSGNYWSSTVSGTNSRKFTIYYNVSADMSTPNRAYGFSVRCIKD